MRRHLPWLLVAFLVLFPALGARAAMVDRIAAVVDDQVIALSEVYDLGGQYIEQQCPGEDPVCRRKMELQILDTLVMRALIEEELKKLDLDVTDQELDRATDQIARENSLDGVDGLRKAVEASGLAWDVYRAQLKEQIRQLKFNEAVIQPRVQISDDELLDLYKRTKDDYASSPTAKVQAITIRVPDGSGQQGMVDTVTKARDVRQQVIDGTLSWDDAVKQYHSGMFTGPDGMLPPVKKGDLTEALDKAIFASKAGDIPEPILVKGTVFLLKVLDLQQGGTKSFDDVKDELRSKLSDQKGEEQLQQWYQQAKRKASVKILLAPPESLQAASP
jgi:peptidyl-prolyl cis-trans isomerase SurA